jgi:hypothetical protein
LKDAFAMGGYRKIYENLIERLQYADIATSARRLGLSHILLQLVFYDQDDEFPARTTSLFDRNATQLIDFEALAVLVTVFVQSLTRMNCEGDP